MKSRSMSLYGPFLLRDMCVSRECRMQRVSKLPWLKFKETALTTSRRTGAVGKATALR